ncbi:MAG: hypothetical protein ACRELB_11660 [Polyangiaceae bacterium]
MIHDVKQGECLASIAARYGLPSAGDLYDLPENAGLKKAGRHPNILAPGDQVTVPDPPARWETRSTEQRHRFVVPTTTVKLRVFVRSGAGDGYEGKRFVLTIGDRKIEGTSKSGGLVEAEVPAGAQDARLELWTDDDPDDPSAQVDRALAIGHLDPVETIAGVQARLHNLGYPCAVTGAIDDATLVAARAFREKNGLPVPGDDGDEGDASGDEPKGDDGNDEADGGQKDDPAAALVDDALRAKLRASHEGA